MQMVFPLFAGLIIAFALQLLLTNLGIALGLTVIQWAPESDTVGQRDDREPRDREPDNSEPDNSELDDGEPRDSRRSHAVAAEESRESDQSSGAELTLPITHLAGVGVAFSLSTVLFAASFLATELSAIAQPLQGLVFGITLWAAYLLLFIWLSSTTLSGVVDSVLGTAVGGGRRLLSALRRTIAPPKDTDSQTPATDPAALRSIAAELSQVADFQAQLPRLLREQREILLAEICDRTSLSTDQATLVLDSLQSSPSSPSSSPSPPSSSPSPLSSLSSSSSSSPPSPAPSSSPPSSLNSLSRSSLLNADSVRDVLDQLGLPNGRQLLHTVLNRVDLSDWDIERLWTIVQSLQGNSSDGGSEGASSHAADQSSAPSFDIIHLDVEDYLLHTPAWSLQPDIFKEEFYERLYDPDATPELILEQLKRLDRSHFVNWLQERGDLTDERVEKIADQLTPIHHVVLDTVKAEHEKAKTEQAEKAARIQDEALESNSKVQIDDLSPETAKAFNEFHDKLIAYCRYTNLDKLTAESLADKVRSQLEEHQLLTEEGQFLPELSKNGAGHDPSDLLDLQAIEAVLARRQGMSTVRQTKLIDALQTTWQSYQPTSSDRTGLQNWHDDVSEKLNAYIQSVDWSAVSLEDVKPALLNLLNQSETGRPLDWETLQSKLSVPPDIQAELEDWLQQAWRQLSKPPRRWASRISHSAQSLADRLLKKLTQYLQYQDKSAFNPTQMAQDLTHLVNEGVRSLPNPLDRADLSFLKPLLDREAWQQTLEARRDMTAAEIQTVLESLESAWQTAIQSLKAWAGERWSDISEFLSFSENGDKKNPADRASEPSHEDGENALQAARRQIVSLIETTQEQLQAQALEVKKEIQRKTDAVRRQVAIAAWWLFISLLTSGVSAAAAGWLSVIYAHHFTLTP